MDSGLIVAFDPAGDPHDVILLAREVAANESWHDGAVGPCIEGHVVTEAVEYVDGAVVGRCSGCGERVYLPTVAGGISLVRIKTLVERLMGIRDSGLADEAPANVMVGLMAELSELVVDHAHEHVKLTEAGKLLEIAKRLVRQLESAAG